MFKQYLQVTKPGIIFGNLISVIGGFLLASKGHIDYPLFVWTLLGVSLVVASGCVFNNYIDRDIDRKMERTKNRVLVKGLISPEASLVYATLLGIAGFMLLWFGANPLACWLGVMGFVVYVGVYSLYMKRHSVYGTLIGSLSGAAPPVIGYCAVTGDFDSGAAILLAIFSLWQMPHSYAIAIFRFRRTATARLFRFLRIGGLRCFSGGCRLWRFGGFRLFDFGAGVLPLFRHKFIDFVKGHNHIAGLRYGRPGLFLLGLRRCGLFGCGDRLGGLRGNILRRASIQFFIGHLRSSFSLKLHKFER